jgi:hypothetical protein
MALKIFSGIYKITNTVNGKIYIGSAVNIPIRRNKHFSLLSRNIHPNQFLQNSYNKNGKDCFCFETIELVENKCCLLEREQYFIDLHRSNNRDIGYNIAKIAGSTMGIPSPMKGIPRPESVKEKLRIANTGKKQPRAQVEKRLKTLMKNGGFRHTENAKTRISQTHQGENNPFFGRAHNETHKSMMSEKFSGTKNPFFGKTHDDEFRKKSSLIHKGKVLSEETRQKLSLAGKGRKQSKEHIEKRIAAAVKTKSLKLV